MKTEDKKDDGKVDANSAGSSETANNVAPRATEEEIRRVVKKMFVDEPTYINEFKKKIAGENEVLQKLFKGQDPYPLLPILSKMFGPRDAVSPSEQTNTKKSSQQQQQPGSSEYRGADDQDRDLKDGALAKIEQKVLHNHAERSRRQGSGEDDKITRGEVHEILRDYTKSLESHFGAAATREGGKATSTSLIGNSAVVGQV